ncbi:MAG: hypothetical protein KKD07_05550 [Candidatus Omnitrophica bacterium]|nr:hypothetical protein [Candidatus Omnitrophota bacterium]MBU1996324.1 hypothetical protein [Candidatus Omnitrophota bacterium]MBU4333886.1 hypothetical protein [Candidatus Omnitrophota bacterium]
MSKKDENEAFKNCAACKKALLMQRRYYRNNAYYCNNNCFQNKQKADAEKAEADAAGAAV